jgi:flagellar biosynthesis GTPase FlhF
MDPEITTKKAEEEKKKKLEKKKLEKERLEKERLEKESLEKERLEKERLEKERLEKESLEKESLEKERLEKEKKAEEAAAGKAAEEAAAGKPEKVFVPKKSEVTKEDIAKGKKSKVRFNFILEGWSFENFYRLVERSGFKILFIGNEGIHGTNLEVVGLDYNGKPVLEERSWDLSWPTRGYPVESIPKDEEVAGWADYDDQIREDKSLDSSHRMHLFFPHHIKEILKKAANVKNENLGETDSRVKFTITKDYEIEIQ